LLSAISHFNHAYAKFISLDSLMWGVDISFDGWRLFFLLSSYSVQQDQQAMARQTAHWTLGIPFCRGSEQQHKGK